jgi:hypothetical protein
MKKLILAVLSIAILSSCHTEEQRDYERYLFIHQKRMLDVEYLKSLDYIDRLNAMDSLRVELENINNE